MERSHALRAGAALVAAGTFALANVYVVQHPKNSAAPLQPPAPGDVVVRGPAASAAPSAQPAAPARATARTSARPVPQITLQPGVRATALPGITFTHVS